jgi:hypothetical protein
MPRPKKTAAPLTLGEFDRLAESVSELIERMRATLMAHAPSLDAMARLESAGFFTRPGAAGATPKRLAPKAAERANGVHGNGGHAAPKGRRRRESRIEPAKIVAAVKAGGTAGRTSGEIAKALDLDIEPLRHQLYVLRDAGALKMVGKLGGAKYVVADGKAKTKPATPSKSAAKKKAAKNAPKETPTGAAAAS